MTWRQGTVTEVGRAWDGAQELTVLLTSGAAGTRAADGGADAPGTGDAAETSDGVGVAGELEPGSTVRALAYPELVGRPHVGDRVLLGAGALARSLGTGGYATVVALPDALPADPPPGPGHVVKARYTPMQAMVLGVDEQESPHHEALREADSLGGMPVVVADLHSALPAILAGWHHARGAVGAAAPAYVMTDGGALPAWFSRNVATLRAAGLLGGVVTVGQAFGGDLEAVNLHTGLLAAREVLGAPAAIVAQGPGNLGTGTRWGFSGTAVGEALNAAAVLGGAPIAALRVSGADARPRHRGISHHSTTAVGRVALAPCDVAVPVFDAADELEDSLPGGAAGFGALLDSQLPELLGGRHRAVPVSTAGLAAALAAVPLRLSTMGRGLDEDPASFLAAAVAGVHAAALAGV